MTSDSELAGNQDFQNFKFKNHDMPNLDSSKTAPSEFVLTKQPNLGEPTDPSLEQEGELANLQRVRRDISYANIIDTARADSNSLTKVEQTQITNSLERRKWGGILRNLQKGDRVVSILSSTSELLSIKNLNDNIFGSQTTDSIIAKRRHLTETFFKRALSAVGLTSKELENVSLEQNYKFGTFKIPAHYDLDVVSVINQVCAEVDSEIKKFIIDLADIEQSNNPEKTTLLQNFRGAVNSEGYKMTFGAAVVETDNLDDIILAVNGSLQTARAVAFENSDGYGEQFSSERMVVKIDQINELRNKLISEGNTLIGTDGTTHEIFIENKGKLELNKDLLREVRKDKFVCRTDQTKILKELKNYVRSLNIFDIVKPFTADEVEDIKNESKQMDAVINGIHQDSPDSYAKAADILDTNEKDSHFTSETRFHSEAIKIKNCAYLSLDVLDVGVDQLLDFEQRVQFVANKEMTFEQASLEAGDLMTKKLRQMRESVFKICDEFKITKNGRMDGLVGGDELTLAIDLDATDETGKKIFDQDDKKLNKLIHRLKKETNSRVVKTVIAENRRHSDSENIVERMKEHLLALKNAEEGTNQAKQIENELRKLKKFLQQHPDSQGVKILLDDFEDFVVTEVDDHFVIRTENGPDLNLTEILQKFMAIQKE